MSQKEMVLRSTCAYSSSTKFQIRDSSRGMDLSRSHTSQHFLAFQQLLWEIFYTSKMLRYFIFLHSCFKCSHETCLITKIEEWKSDNGTYRPCLRNMQRCLDMSFFYTPLQYLLVCFLIRKQEHQCTRLDNY